jgi:hypothetical protein
MRRKLLPAEQLFQMREASEPAPLTAASTKKKFRKSRKVFIFNLPRTFAIVRLFLIFSLDSTRKTVTRALTNSSRSLFADITGQRRALAYREPWNIRTESVVAVPMRTAIRSAVVSKLGTTRRAQDIKKASRFLTSREAKVRRNFW